MPNPTTASASRDPDTWSIPLEVPPVPRVVPDGVFDAYGWASSSQLRVCGPRPLGQLSSAVVASITTDNPPGMLFVRLPGAVCTLPFESASGHSGHAYLRDRQVLAPWAIDDATDGLFEQGCEPAQEFELWIGDFAGLYWGLHDWAHFHHHGPFEDRAWTEVQCDLSALHWLATNREALDLHDEPARHLVGRALSIMRERFSASLTPAPNQALRRALATLLPPAWCDDDM